VDILTVRARIGAVVQAAGFAPSPEPFSFELAPQQALDAAYYLQTALTGGTTLFGWGFEERHTVTLWLVRTTSRDPHAAHDGLLAVCSSFAASLSRDGAEGDYNLDVSGWEVPPPGDEDDFVLARWSAALDFERQL
jgi:hypothetical protein